MGRWASLLPLLLAVAGCDRLLPFGASPAVPGDRSVLERVPPDRPGPVDRRVEAKVRWDAPRDRGADRRPVDRRVDTSKPVPDRSPSKEGPAPAKDSSPRTTTDAKPPPADVAVTCPGGRTPCGGACVDTKTDPMNCGVCGKICRLGCVGGNCVGVACEPALCALGCCDKSGTCVTTPTDTACGKGGAPCLVCRGKESCCGGQCCVNCCGGKICCDGLLGACCGSTCCL